MLILIANPSSRSGAGKTLWKTWERALAERGVPYALLVTASREDCEEKARRACHDGATPVAVGGDGTINAVLAGVGRAAEEDAARPMGVLYAGTSPDFCRFHRIPTDGQGALDTLLAGHTAQVDIAAVAFTGEDGRETSGYFGCGCNIGLGAATATFANRWRKTLGDGLGTGLGLVRAMLGHRPFACRLVIDGEAVELTRANHLIILKNPHIASGLRVGRAPESADGSLLVLAIHGYSPVTLLGLIPAAYSGSLESRRGVYARSCASVQIEAAPLQSVEFDGDARGICPVSVRVLPKALSLICNPSPGGCHA